MKKIAVFLVCIAFTINVYSQTDNWYFSFSMGGTLPIGIFSQTDIGNAKSGLAKNGFALLLDASYPLSNHWGLKGMALVNTNPVDRNSLGAKLESRMNAAAIIVADADREFLSLRTNSWMWNALLAGPVYAINLDRISWDFHLLGGMNVVYLPQQKMLYEKPANSWYYLDRNTTTTKVSYGLLAGTAFRFPVSERINLKIGFDYFRSNATVPFEQIKVTKQGETVLTQKLGSGSSNIPIEMLSGSIGFVYYLN
jgi:hypothetical protein